MTTTARRGLAAGVLLGTALGALWLLGNAARPARGESPPAPGEVKKLGRDEAEMAWVPGGAFRMGASRLEWEALDDEKPEREVTVEGFWLDRLEVTNAQVERFLRETGTQITGTFSVMHLKGNYLTWLEELKDQAKEAKEDVSQYAAVGLTWDQAEAYCAWAEKRLPTETEWERAARGDEGRRYPWGSIYDPTRVNGDYKIGHVGPVGRYPEGVGPYGHLDLAGNAQEWTSSFYERYPGNRSSYGDRAYGTRYRVNRGGSWKAAGRYLRATVRFANTPDFSYPIVGVRCAKS